MLFIELHHSMILFNNSAHMFDATSMIAAVSLGSLQGRVVGRNGSGCMCREILFCSLDAAAQSALSNALPSKENDYNTTKIMLHARGD